SKNTIDEVKDFSGTFAGDYSLIIKRVKALITGVLSQFATASNATRKAELRDLPLSGGLHLFFGASGQVFTKQTFFTNQFIGSFQIVFEAYMSVEEARAIGIQQILVTTQLELEMLNKQILEVREAQAKSLSEILKDNPNDYLSTKATYQLILDSLKVDRDKLLEEYDKYNEVVKTVDHLILKLDLSEFNIKSNYKNPLELKHIFNEWELGIAKRYIQEKMSSENH
ncbi:MAG: hypothetical protein MI975_24770, partial [Cytophagales bacterium]|nr:hypothetical protein [Cytophagales bacterium]